MDIGFIGAGRVGCSIGRYLADGGQTVVGYYDVCREASGEAAEFVGTRSYEQIEELVADSGVLFLTTPDSMILPVWEQLKRLPLAHKLICHCSGALSSGSLSDIEGTGASCCSIHPMLPFSNRFSSYKNLNKAFFTIEGQTPAVEAMTKLFTGLGNQVCRINSGHKAVYHAAASILSNQVIAVLDTGYRLLETCGFSREEAVSATANLVRQNVENVIASDCVEALTGPIDRGDVETVKKHLSCLNDEDHRMYQVLGEKLVQLAQKKHPSWDYKELEQVLKGDEER